MKWHQYVASVREWYGWHFPELHKLVPDGVSYARCVLAIGMASSLIINTNRGAHLGQPRAGLRDDAATADLTGILPEEVATSVKQAALYSMGTDITPADLQPIQECCTKLIAHVQEYRPTD